jgi:hypothetical protein
LAARVSDSTAPIAGKCQSFLDNVLAQFVGIRARNYRSGTLRSSSCAAFGLLVAGCLQKLLIRHPQAMINTSRSLLHFLPKIACPSCRDPSYLRPIIERHIGSRYRCHFELRLNLRPRPRSSRLVCSLHPAELAQQCARSDPGVLRSLPRQANANDQHVLRSVTFSSTSAPPTICLTLTRFLKITDMTS